MVGYITQKRKYILPKSRKTLSYLFISSLCYYSSDIMASSQAGSSNEPTIVEVLTTNRNTDLFGQENGCFDLVKLSDGSKKARCRRCSALLQAASNSSLRGHKDRYCSIVKQNPGGSSQTTIDMHGGVFMYDFNKVQDQMAKFVIQTSLPFNHFDHPKLTRMIRETLQPSYKHVSRTTLKGYCMKLWKQVKGDLIVFFATYKPV